jgi:hypothetical protein
MRRLGWLFVFGVWAGVCACGAQPSRKWTSPVITVRCGGSAALAIDEDGSFTGGETGTIGYRYRLSFGSGGGMSPVDEFPVDAPSLPAREQERLSKLGRFKLLEPGLSEDHAWNVRVSASFSAADYKTIAACLSAHRDELDAALSLVRPLPRGVPDARSGLAPRLATVRHLTK